MQPESNVQPIDHLFDSMVRVEPYPTGVVPVTARIAGTAFFPGGNGLWEPQNGFTQNPIMILGHDFDSKTGFEASLLRGGEVTTMNGLRVMGPTWRNAIRLLEDAAVDPTTCFFTNAYMGLRESSSNTGRFPGASNEGFVTRCRAFLALQIQTIRPRAILTLGTWVPSFIAALAPELSIWTKARTLVGVDRIGPMTPAARFSGEPDIVCPVGALTHPSLRAANIHRRRYRGTVGHSAELELIRDVLSHVASDKII